jgi:hypothetical protein
VAGGLDVPSSGETVTGGLYAADGVDFIVAILYFLPS